MDGAGAGDGLYGYYLSKRKSADFEAAAVGITVHAALSLLDYRPLI